MRRRSYLQNIADSAPTGRALVSPSQRVWPEEARPPAVPDMTVARPLVSPASPQRIARKPVAPSPLPTPPAAPPLTTSMPSVPARLSEQPAFSEQPVPGLALPLPVSLRSPEQAAPISTAVIPSPSRAAIAPMGPELSVAAPPVEPAFAPRTLPPTPVFASPVALPAPSEPVGSDGPAATPLTAVAKDVAAHAVTLREPGANEEPAAAVKAEPIVAHGVERRSRALPHPDFDVPPPTKVAEPTAQERSVPTVHIGVIEVRSPIPPAPPQVIREVAAPPRAQPATPLVRGLAWRYGLVQS